MASKKLIGGLLLAIIGISLVALIPVFMYGFSVNVAEVNLSVITSSLSTSSFSDETQDSYSYNWGAGWDSIPQISEKTVSAYEYFFEKLDGIMDASEVNPIGDAVVNIEITLNLTNPSDNSLYFTFEPKNLKGEGLKNIEIILGPDEFNGESGTFLLTITISIEVILPLGGVVYSDILTPVDLSFEIPN
ncbi:MAG: hypothetical protein ACFE85_12555 [Candidatus Hodarchaeota archaeon]